MKRIHSTYDIRHWTSIQLTIWLACAHKHCRIPGWAWLIPLIIVGFYEYFFHQSKIGSERLRFFTGFKSICPYRSIRLKRILSNSIFNWSLVAFYYFKKLLNQALDPAFGFLDAESKSKVSFRIFLGIVSSTLNGLYYEIPKNSQRINISLYHFSTYFRLLQLLST